MKLVVGCALLLAGCDQLFDLRHIDPTSDARGADSAGTDATVADARSCFGGGLATVCIPAGTPIPGSFGGGTISTDSACTFVATQAGGPELCVVAAAAIDLESGSLIGQGSRPLVLLALTTITIKTSIDVASHQGAASGPGADVSCMPGAIDGGGDANGGGGGAGGSFQGSGGMGGAAIGAGGVPDPVTSGVAVVRAGCPGGQGGTGGAYASMPRPRTRSGGALYLIAGESITVTATATIDACGESAASSGPSAGGGGGASGGLIGMDARSVTVMPGATIYAIGGGGAQGGGVSNDGGGATDPTPVDIASGSPGGCCSDLGGFGGAGSSAARPTGTAGMSVSDVSSRGAGGGGGGGGDGYFFVFATTRSVPPTMMIAPAPS